MYSRAERNLVQHVGSTSQNVGPGTYDINSIEGRAHVFGNIFIEKKLLDLILTF